MLNDPASEALTPPITTAPSKLLNIAEIHFCDPGFITPKKNPARGAGQRGGGNNLLNTGFQMPLKF